MKLQLAMCAMTEVVGAYDRVGHFIELMDNRNSANSLRDYFEKNAYQIAQYSRFNGRI